MMAMWFQIKGQNIDYNKRRMSNMTLNYKMIVRRYPKPNEVVGNLIPNYELFNLLAEKIFQDKYSLLKG